MKSLVECGGKMHLREGEFEKAHTDFFEAFKNYDESGELLINFKMELFYKSITFYYRITS